MTAAERVSTALANWVEAIREHGEDSAEAWLGMWAMQDAQTARYEIEVVVETKDGRHVTYRSDGVAPAGTSGDQLLDSAEQTALQQQPGGQIVSSRARRA